MPLRLGHPPWARLRATVTGTDFSEPAVAAARKLSRDARVPGRFTVCALYDTPATVSEQFDIVSTGVGALCWIPDIRGWARVVSDTLSPGGTFCILEYHPVLWSLDDERADGELVIKRPYFEAAQPT